MGYRVEDVELIYYNKRNYKKVVIFEDGVFLGEFIIPRIVSDVNIITYLQNEGKIL